MQCGDASLLSEFPCARRQTKTLKLNNVVYNYIDYFQIPLSVTAFIPVKVIEKMYYSGITTIQDASFQSVLFVFHAWKEK